MNNFVLGDARNESDLLQLGKFSLIVVDPPWQYADQRKIRKDGKTPTRGIGACHHYESMTTDEICAMPVVDLAAERCHLYLWATCPLLPDAMRVMTSWGFTWATIAFVWIKMNKGAWAKAQREVCQASMFETSSEQVGAFMDSMTWFGPGFYTGSNVEFVLLGRRGRPFQHIEGCKASQVIFATHGEHHSQKPEEIQDRIEWMYPQASPYLELFARRTRKNWICFGNEERQSTYRLRGGAGDAKAMQQKRAT